MRSDTRTTIENYVRYGIHPGNFVFYLLANDLFNTYRYADPYNKENLAEIIQYIYDHVPSGCWGNQEKVVLWLKKTKASQV